MSPDAVYTYTPYVPQKQFTFTDKPLTFMRLFNKALAIMWEGFPRPSGQFLLGADPTFNIVTTQAVADDVQWRLQRTLNEQLEKHLGILYTCHLKWDSLTPKQLQSLPSNMPKNISNAAKLVTPRPCITTKVVHFAHTEAKAIGLPCHHR